jgi:tRNA A-37 threonylcarbamoyl transferase component Bud32
MQAVTLEGSQIGAYRLVRQIGAGGMGAVWLAEHAMLGRRAAVKVLHPAFTARPEIVTRFFNEAKAASTIADPGIVQIFDFGHHTDGSAYIVMELLDGEPLDDRLKQHGRLQVGDALRILRQVATSLGAAHARGIVHRDLKPENIFLARDAEVAGGERAKLLDFGIAKLSQETDAGVKTQTSAIMGTPTYMSPEQCRGAGGVDARSDVYALGCVLFTLITGRPPFVADGIGDIIAMHLREPAPRAAATAPWIPGAVDDVIARCLAKDPAERYANGAELAPVFDALLARISVAEAGPTAPVIAVPSTPTTLSSAAAVTPAARRTRRAWPLAMVAVALCAVATVAMTELGGGDETPGFDAPPPATPTVPPPAAAMPSASAPSAATTVPPPTPTAQVPTAQVREALAVEPVTKAEPPLAGASTRRTTGKSTPRLVPGSTRPSPVSPKVAPRSPPPSEPKSPATPPPANESKPTRVDLDGDGIPDKR